MGHLLGTGLLGEEATERVVRLLADSRMDSGFGHRLPELYGGDSAADLALPSAYPVRHPVRTSTALGAFTLRGLQAGEDRLECTWTTTGWSGSRDPNEGLTDHGS
jgi:hypothetical protein